MLIVAPDFARRIDLPGAGPCPRPAEIDRTGTGFCDLVALRVYSFAKGVVIDGEAEHDEVFIVAMRGAAGIAITQHGHAAQAFELGAEGGVRAVYMPPNSAYRLTARGDCDIAYARAQPSGAGLPGVRGFAASGDRLDIAGHAQAMDLALVTALAGDSIALGGSDRSAERFVHVRAHGPIRAALGDAVLGDWSTAALSGSDARDMTIVAGSGEILIVAAATNGQSATPGSMTTQ